MSLSKNCSRSEAWSFTVKHAQVAAQGPRQKVHKGAETQMLPSII